MNDAAPKWTITRLSWHFPYLLLRYPETATLTLRLIARLLLVQIEYTALQMGRYWLRLTRGV
jgi:hypothetical protein